MRKDQVSNPKVQLRIDQLFAAYKRELLRQLGNVESGVVTINTEIRVNQGGICSSEVQSGFRFSV